MPTVFTKLKTTGSEIQDASGNKVLADQQSAVADASALRTHGLIAT